MRGLGPQMREAESGRPVLQGDFMLPTAPVLGLPGGPDATAQLWPEPGRGVRKDRRAALCLVHFPELLVATQHHGQLERTPLDSGG